MNLSPFIGGGTQTADGVAPLSVQFTPVYGGYPYPVGFSLPYVSGFNSYGNR